jgi:hypothetical protein
MSIGPKGDERGSHAATFEAAAALAESFGQRRTVDDASNLRLVRNGAQYRTEEVGAEDANDAVDIGTELADAFEGPITVLLERAGLS